MGAAAGLARSSAYKCFTSGEDILQRIAADAFAAWGAQVSKTVAHATGPDERIGAYTRATLTLAASCAHKIAVLAGGLPPSQPVRERLARAHHDLGAPLRAALPTAVTPDPGLTAELIDGALSRAIGRLDAGHPAEQVIAATVAFVRRGTVITTTAD